MNMLLSAVLAAAPLWAQTAATGMPTARLGFPNGRAIKVDVAATPSDRERGLMFREKLPDDYGMLFVFPVEMDLQFWMKNTLVELDMLFIDKDKRITVIHPRVPRSTRETPEDKLARRSGRGQYVLELPGGGAARFRLKKGQRLRFDVLIPPA